MLGKDMHEKPSKKSVRKSYEPPELVAFGTLSELTQCGPSQCGDDAGFGSGQGKGCPPIEDCT